MANRPGHAETVIFDSAGRPYAWIELDKDGVDLVTPTNKLRVSETTGLTFNGGSVASAGGGAAGNATFAQAGTLATATGVGRFPVPSTLTILGVAATVGTAPTGQSIIFDINKNGTTVFTTQANRPSIAAAAHQTTTLVVPDVTSLALDDYLTVDIDQIGSGTAGSDAVVVVFFH